MVDLVTSNELTGIRTDVEQIFSFRCQVLRSEGRGDLNEATSEYENVPNPTILYDGPYFLTPIISRRDRFDEFGQGLVFTRQYRVDIPFDEDTIQIRDTFIALTSDDTQVVGREMLVRDVLVGTHLGYRRLTVQDTRE